MVAALCDRMVVAILDESQRHKGHSAVVDSPEAPGWDKNVWDVLWVWTTGGFELKAGLVMDEYKEKRQNLFAFSEIRHSSDRGRRHPDVTKSR